MNKKNFQYEKIFFFKTIYFPSKSHSQAFSFYNYTTSVHWHCTSEENIGKRRKTEMNTITKWNTRKEQIDIELIQKCHIPANDQLIMGANQITTERTFSIDDWNRRLWSIGDAHEIELIIRPNDHSNQIWCRHFPHILLAKYQLTDVCCLYSFELFICCFHQSDNYLCILFDGSQHP